MLHLHSRLHGFVAGALATLVSVTALDAQITTFVPDGFQAVEGNTSWPYPWAFTNTTGVRQQMFYDSSNFTGQGVAGPILVNRLRWRADGGATGVSRTWNNATIQMSTCPVDYTAVSATYANNHGPDLTVVYSGPVTANAIVTGNTPNDFFVDVALTTPFLYDPSSGLDLCIEIDHDGTASAGTGARMDLVTTNTTGSLIFSTNQTQTTAASSAVRIGHAMIMEIGWAPPGGLAAAFAVSTRTGPSPLTVAFTDQSWSSDPAGVVAWNWDFDNDGVIDSQQQNPTHTYTQCGTYTVRLTVFDAAHPAQSIVRTAFIVTDVVDVSFTQTLLVAPNVWQFTDTSTPTPQSWAWDFNDDGVVDSTAQNPVWAFVDACGTHPVRLSVTRSCTTSVGSRRVVASPVSLSTTFVGGGGINSANPVGNMFDAIVTAPDGINVCALTMTPYTFYGPFTCTVYVTGDSYVGKDADVANWRVAATGTGFGVAGVFNPPTPVDVAVTPFHLPAGNYGLAVFVSGVATNSLAYTQTNIGPFTNADLTLFPDPTTAPGIAKSGFTPTVFSGKWNGTIHYTRNVLSGDAGYGFIGDGCAGALGIPGNEATALPRLNSTLSIDLTRLPQSSAFFYFSTSRTTSVFGPLPIDLTGFGLAGCSLRVSPDSLVFLVGGSNTATINLAIPGSGTLLGTVFFTQGGALDPAANAAGLVTTDAAGGVVGN